MSCRCYSFVGKVSSPGGQTVSIGSGCAYIDTVEHELLHALGFYHEQSRYDRDDHVSIVWGNIKEGSQTSCVIDICRIFNFSALHLCTTVYVRLEPLEQFRILEYKNWN